MKKVNMKVNILGGYRNAGIEFFCISDEKRMKSIAVRMANSLYKYSVVKEVSENSKEFLMTDEDSKLFMQEIDGLNKELKSLKASILNNYDDNIRVFEENIKKVNNSLLEIALESIPTKQDIEQSFFYNLEFADYLLSEDEETKEIFIDKFINISKDMAQVIDNAIISDKITLMKEQSIAKLALRLKSVNVFSVPEFEFCKKSIKFNDIEDLTSLFLNLSEVIDLYHKGILKEAQTSIKLVKEYCSDAKTCVIRTTTYNHTAKYFKKLITEAKKDFPLLADNNISIIHYGGRIYKGTFGIEFPVNEEPKEDYLKIKELELSL